MLTSLLETDHIDRGFVKLVNRIAMMLSVGIPRIDLATKLYDEGFTATDIRLAYAAAKIKVDAGDPIDDMKQDRCSGCRMVAGQHKMSCIARK